VRVVWTPEALQDRADVWGYVEAENPQAAVRMDELFSKAAAMLANYPELGRPGKTQGTRELIPHRNYRLVYEISDDAVWVLALVHMARQWPLVRE
jgi:toxin ParE1/3/4